MKVTGCSNRRVSLAALLCVKPGQRPRLIYRVHRHHRRRRGDQRKGFTETDCAALPDAAHQQLACLDRRGLWDNLNVHVSDAMTRLIAARDSLTSDGGLAVCARAEPGGTSLVTPEKIAGQPGQTQPRPAHRPDQDPAQADAVPARPPRRLPRQHRARPHTLLGGHTTKDL